MGRRPRENFITLDDKYYPVWLNGQPLQIPIRDFSIINNDIPDESSIGVGQFHYDPSDLQGLIKGSINSSGFNNNRTTIFETIDDEDTMDEDEEIEDDMDENDIDEDEDEFGYDDNFGDDGFDFKDTEEKNDEMDEEDGKHSTIKIMLIT